MYMMLLSFPSWSFICMFLFSFSFFWQLFCRIGINHKHPEGVGWREVSLPEKVGILQVSVSPTGIVWAVTHDGTGLVRTQVSREYPLGKKIRKGLIKSNLFTLINNCFSLLFIYILLFPSHVLNKRFRLGNGTSTWKSAALSSIHGDECSMGTYQRWHSEFELQVSLV